MVGAQLVNQVLTGVVVAFGVVILAGLWAVCITAVAAMDRRRAIRDVQRSATAITAAAASASEAARRGRGAVRRS